MRPLPRCLLTGPSPVNRGKPGSKHYLICDGKGTPIYMLTSGANVPDISRARTLLGGYPPTAGLPRARHRTDHPQHPRPRTVSQLSRCEP